MAGVAGFEPTNDGIKTRCLTTWRHPKMNWYSLYIIFKKSARFFLILELYPLKEADNGALGGIRTHDPCLRRAILYPAELQAQDVFLYARQYSIQLSYKRKMFFYMLVFV